MKRTRCDAGQRTGKSSLRAAVVIGLMVAGYMGWLGQLQPAVAQVQLADATSHPAAGQSWTNSLGMKFVRVEGLDVLFGKWETRVQDFRTFVEATGYDATQGMYSLHSDGWKQHGESWGDPGFEQGPTHPVAGIGIDDAKAFCRWLTEEERKAKRLGPHQAYRLPSDHEWSVTVGLLPADTTGGNDRVAEVENEYPWGQEFPPGVGAGNYAGDEARDADWPPFFPTIAAYRDPYPRTAPVGQFTKNRHGIYDLGGNVWEWCEDTNRTAHSSGVLRGGSWHDVTPENIRSARRIGAHPGPRDAYAGFRCVLAMSPEE